MQWAKIVNIEGVTIIRSPYDPELVTEIKRIPGRKYDGNLKVWSVPSQYEEYARAIVRKYFPIEDEPSAALEGIPEPAGPFAVLKLEFIAENYYAYKRTATIPHEGTERFKGYLGRNQSRPWVKRLVVHNDHLIGEFVHGQIDYSQANSTGSRGVYLYFYLASGFYEVNERVSWTRVRRYCIRVEDATITELSQEEVKQCLSKD